MHEMRRDDMAGKRKRKGLRPLFGETCKGILSDAWEDHQGREKESEMSRSQIYDDINAERDRQDVIHPQLPKYILHPIFDPTKKQFRLTTQIRQEANNLREGAGDHSWYGVLNEEDGEVFSAETIEELDTELVQSIALRVRLLEALRDGLVNINSKQ